MDINKVKNDAIAIIEHTHMIEAEVQKDNWILCSDELPEENDEFLILWKCENHKGIWYEIQEFYDGEWALNLPHAHGKVEVLAWQPLPEIPKELIEREKLL